MSVHPWPREVAPLGTPLMEPVMLASMQQLRGASVEWGVFHLLVAQRVLGRPILFAHPVQGDRKWYWRSLNDLVADFIGCDCNIHVEEGLPLNLLPTKANGFEGPVEFGSLSHFEALLPMEAEQEAMDQQDFELAFYEARLEFEMAERPFWENVHDECVFLRRNARASMY